jgi:hypothetical protein
MKAQRIITFVLAGVLLLAIAARFAAAAEPLAASTDWLTEPDLGWERVTHDSGRGRKTTAFFTIPTGKWQVKWKVAPANLKPGLFYISAHGDTTAIVANGQQREGVKQFDKPGRYYLTIDAEDYGWVIVVEKAKP